MDMWPLRTLTALVGMVLPLSWLPAQPSELDGLDFGSYEPGWRFELLHDTTRRYTPSGDGEPAGPRPVPLTIWYPAKPATGTTARFADLARLGAYQTSESPSASLAKDQIAQLIQFTSQGTAETTLRSRRGAEPATGTFPLILFAHTTPVGQAVMSEYLASHGFVVAGLMSKGVHSGPYRLSVEDVRGMVDDLTFALDSVREHAFVDTGRVLVIGMSNGAFGAIGLARRVPILGIVSLDGTVGERAASRILPELGATTSHAPPALLHLFTPDNQYIDFAFLKTWSGVCGTVRVPGLAHRDFLSYGALSPSTPSSRPPRVRVMEKFAAMSRLTLLFLQHATSGTGPVRLPELNENEQALGMSTQLCREPRD